MHSSDKWRWRQMRRRRYRSAEGTEEGDLSSELKAVRAESEKGEKIEEREGPPMPGGEEEWRECCAL